MKHNTPSEHSISRAKVFADCTPKQLRRLDEISTPVSVKAGAELTHEDRIGREFGVLLDGTATVTIGDDVVATLVAGDHYGEVALLQTVGGAGGHRTATVTADCDLEVVVMSMQEFATLLVEFPSIAESLRETAARRTSENAHRI